MLNCDIGIWGPTHAGKTTYLAALYLEMLTSPNWELTLNYGDSEETEQFILNTVNRFRQGEFPPSTDRRFYRYDFDIKSRTDGLINRIWNRNAYQLRLLDVPGLVVDPRPLTSDAYFQDLLLSDGILVLIDPEVMDETGKYDEAHSFYEVSLSQLIQTITANRVSSEFPNLAICLTKIDLDNHWKRRLEPDIYLPEIIGQRGNALLKENIPHSKYKVFSVSTVGRYVMPNGHDRPNIIQIPAKNAYRIARPQFWKPFQILDPMFWLFERTNRDKLSLINRETRKKPK